MDNWQQLDGFYVQDDSLDDCETGNGKLPYRHIEGNGFMWYRNADSRWIGSITLCNSTLSKRKFKTIKSVTCSGHCSPDQVTSGEWTMTKEDISGTETHPILTVTAVSTDNCGKSFFSKYHSF